MSLESPQWPPKIRQFFSPDQRDTHVKDRVCGFCFSSTLFVIIAVSIIVFVHESQKKRDTTEMTDWCSDCCQECCIYYESDTDSLMTLHSLIAGYRAVFFCLSFCGCRCCWFDFLVRVFPVTLLCSLFIWLSQSDSTSSLLFTETCPLTYNICMSVVVFSGWWWWWLDTFRSHKNKLLIPVCSWRGRAEA